MFSEEMGLLPSGAQAAGDWLTRLSMNDQRQRREEVGGRVNHVTCGVQKPKDMLGSNMPSIKKFSRLFFLVLQLLQIRESSTGCILFGVLVKHDVSMWSGSQGLAKATRRKLNLLFWHCAVA